MACTIDNTAGGVAANSYASIAEADAYHDSHVSGAAWAALVTDMKCKALQQATRQLDAYLEWAGFATTTTQGLAWPRIGLTYRATGALVDSTTLPEQLKEATAEQARLLATVGDRAIDTAQAQQGLKRIEAGPVEIEWADIGSVPGALPTIAPSAYNLIAEWVLRRKNAGSVPLVRV